MATSPRTLDVYWSFRSPYSYFAVDRLREIGARDDVALRMRFVRPLALREDGFFSRGRPQFVPYLLRDVFREGERLGIPIAMPQPDPIVMDMASGEVPEDQPYIHRLYRIGVAAEVLHGAGLATAAAIAKSIWRGVENWHQGDHLKEACAAAGQDIAALEAWAADNDDEIARVIAENEAAQLRHHWGVPLMVIDDDEPFFGQDRLASLVWRLDQKDA